MAINFLNITETLVEARINDNTVGLSLPTPRLAFKENGSVSGGISTTGGNLILETSSGIEKLRINGSTGGIKLADYGGTGLTGTATFNLSVDSAGNVIQTANPGTGSGTVTGSGEATRVAFWSSTSALSSDANLYWDNTNDRLGVGTNAPGERLTVDGDIRILSGNKLILNRANNGTNSEIYTDTTGKIILNSVNSEGIGVQNAGSTVLTIDGTGNVGIGTTAPTALFQTKLETTFSMGISNEFVSTYVSKLKLGRVGISSVSNMEFVYDIANQEFGSIKRNYTGSALKFERGTTLDMIIDGSGKVGIGATAPSSPLEVKTTYTDAYTPAAFNDKSQIKINTAAVTDNYAGIQFTHGGFSEGFFGFVRTSSAVDIADFVWQIYNGTTNTYVEAMRLGNSGNLGLGTTTPTSRLVIVGASAAQSTIALANTTSSAFWQIQASASANNLLLIGAGNVGIGTTSPGAKLEILQSGNGTNNTIITEDNARKIFIGRDSIKVTDLSNTAANLFLQGNGAGTTFGGNVSGNSFFATQASGGKGYDFTASGSGAGVANMFCPSGFTLAFGTNNAERMRIDSSGLVGIGTTSSSYPLEIAKTSATSFAYQRTGVSAKKWGFDSDNDNTYWKNITDSIFNLTLANGGNVGIGTLTPEQKLHVTGSSDGNSIYTAMLQNNGTAAGTASKLFFMQGGSTIRGAAIGGLQEASSGSPTSMVFETSAAFATPTERMRITSVGNVGINTTTPQSRLDVRMSNNTTASIGGTISVGSFSGLSFGYAEPGNLNYRHSAIVFERDDSGFGDARGKIHLLNSPSGSTSADLGDARLTILPSGNVGIGTTNATEKLEVAGNSITLSKTRGLGTNYATPEGWVEAAVNTFSNQTGYFTGNFNIIGGTAGNKIEYDSGPFGSRELVWMTVPDTDNNDDGGWNKAMTGFNNSANNGMMSIVYVRRDAGTPSGNFYHGCSGSNTLSLNGSVNTNPYFCAFAISVLPADVWCVSIGIIYATDDANTTGSSLTGSYRLDTGEKIHSGTTYRQRSSFATQEQRVYHYYSTSPSAQLDFARPGFYIIDGSEPTLSEITGGAAGGGDVFWSASGNNIINDNSGSVGIGTTGAYSSDRDLNLSGKGVSLKNNVNGSNNNWSYIYNTATGSSSNLVFATGASLTALTLSHNGSATFTTNTNSGGFVNQVNSNPGSSAYVSKSWTNDVGNAEIWRNSSTRSQTGGAVQSFNIYNTQDVNIWSGGTRAVNFDTSQNATFAGSLFLPDNRDIGWNGGYSAGKPTLAAVGTTMKMFPSGSVSGEQFTLTPTDAIFAGNVGIGSTAPGAKLEVVGDSRIYDSLNVGYRSSTSKTTNLEPTLILSGKNNYSDGTTWFGNYGQLLLSADSNMTSSARRFLITNALDNNKFAIVRSTNSTTNPAVNSTATGINSGTADFVIDNAGKVGIGTDSPTTSLSVQGTTGDGINVIGVGTTASRCFIGLNSSNHGYVSVTGSSGQSPSLINSAGGDSYISAGNVGIGTTSPAAKLDVVSSSSGVSIRVAGVNTDSSAYYYGFMHDAIDLQGTTQVNTFYSGGAIKSSTTIADYAGIRIDTPNVSADGAAVTNNYGVYQSSSLQKNYFAGNIGIGVTNPGNKLNIDSALTNSVLIEGTGTRTLYSYHDSGGVGWASSSGSSFKNLVYLNSAANNIEFYANGSEGMRVADGGNVGIGTTNPSYKLEVSGGAISIKGNAPGNSLRFDSIVSGTATSRNALYVDSSNVFQIGNANYTSNNIVRPTKTSNLHVNGTLRVDALSGNAPAETGYGEPSAIIVGSSGGSADTILGNPGAWLDINVGGDDYYIPLYTAG